MVTIDDVRSLVRSRLPRADVEAVTLLGEGMDNVAFAVDDLVVRFAREPSAEAVHREARVLEVAGRVSPVPVPAPVLVVPELGCLAYRRLPGVPLLELRHRVEPGPVAAALADLLAALHAVPAADVDDVLTADDEPPSVWLEELTADQVPPRYRPAVAAFLATPAPPPGGLAVFSHDDLGIEHVLVDPDSGAVTGVIDWTDAGLVDPAGDPGRVLRDLGPAALDTVLGRLDPGLRDRAWFYARCGAIEDLAYGVQNARSAYVDKAVDSMAWLFAGD